MKETGSHAWPQAQPWQWTTTNQQQWRPQQQPQLRQQTTDNSHDNNRNCNNNRYRDNNHNRDNNYNSNKQCRNSNKQCRNSNKQCRKAVATAQWKHSKIKCNWQSTKATMALVKMSHNHKHCKRHQGQPHTWTTRKVTASGPVAPNAHFLISSWSRHCQTSTIDWIMIQHPFLVLSVCFLLLSRSRYSHPQRHNTVAVALHCLVCAVASCCCLLSVDCYFWNNLYVAVLRSLWQFMTLLPMPVTASSAIAACCQRWSIDTVFFILLSLPITQCCCRRSALLCLYCCWLLSPSAGWLLILK